MPSSASVVMTAIIDPRCAEVGAWWTAGGQLAIWCLGWVVVGLLLVVASLAWEPERGTFARRERVLVLVAATVCALVGFAPVLAGNAGIEPFATALAESRASAAGCPAVPLNAPMPYEGMASAIWCLLWFGLAVPLVVAAHPDRFHDGGGDPPPARLPLHRRAAYGLGVAVCALLCAVPFWPAAMDRVGWVVYLLFPALGFLGGLFVTVVEARGVWNSRAATRDGALALLGGVAMMALAVLLVCSLVAEGTVS